MKTGYRKGVTKNEKYNKNLRPAEYSIHSFVCTHSVSLNSIFLPA